MDGLMDEWAGLIDKWMDGWADGRTDGGMGGWIRGIKGINGENGVGKNETRKEKDLGGE